MKISLIDKAQLEWIRLPVAFRLMICVVLLMAAFRSGKAFFYRLPELLYHQQDQSHEDWGANPDPSIELRAARLDSACRRMAPLFSFEGNANAFFFYLDSLRQANRLDWVNWPEGSGLPEEPLQFGLEGLYPDMIQFCYKLESRDRSARILGLQLTQTEKNKSSSPGKLYGRFSCLIRN
jgi:hypothetical protein